MTTPLVTDKAPQPVSPACDSRRSVEWQVLVGCAASRADSDPAAVVSHHPLCWPALLQLAEQHRLIPLLAEHLERPDPPLIPRDVRARFSEAQRLHAVFTLQLCAELFRLLPPFAEAGIEILVTKGPALSVRCYGNPGMRQYGDIDLIVRERDIRRVTQAMVGQGYQPRVPLTAIDAKKMPGEYVFQKPGTGLLIEFHTERTFRYHPRPVPIEKLFERHAALLIDGRDVPVPSLEDELVLICIHGAKHFWERLMWIADVAALISRQTIDWDRTVAVAREVGAERMLRLGLRLACDVLGAELPAQVQGGVQSDRAVAKLAAQIESNLGSHELHDLGVLGRALFRIRMRGNFVEGATYLLRLSLSPTEEDWVPEGQAHRPALVEAIRRPFRLAKKHGRRSSG